MSDERRKPAFGRFFIALLALEAMFISGIVLLGQALPQSQAIALISIAALAMILIIAASAFKMLWNPLLAAYPPREIPRTAQRRSFQSFSFGFVNMGLSINAAVDDEYLHIEPIFPMRLVGAHSASIPFTAMKPAEQGRGVLIDGRTMMGPKWCFEKVTG